MNASQMLPVDSSPLHGAAGLRPDPQEIARLAYFAWEHDGRPEGRDVDYWLEAESRLRHAREYRTLKIHPQTVLVVDDDAFVCKTISTVLRHEGYRVFDTTNPLEALRIVEGNGHIDLLLTDYQMPGMTGVQLAGKLRAGQPRLPVLLISGTPEALEAGGGVPADVAFRTKPGIVAEVASVVGELLHTDAA